MFKLMKFIIITFVFATFAIPASALVVFDPTNFVQNYATAAATVKTASQQVDAYIKQLEQYKTQVQQLQGINPSSVSSLLAPNVTELQNALNLRSDLTRLYGSISTVQGMFTQRLDIAKALDKTWSQYVAFEQDRLNKNQSAAVQKAQEEFRALERVNRDYQFASDAESKIAGTAGTHEAMQLMNTQMNRVITQNADIIRSLNLAIGANSGTGEAQMQKAVTQQRELTEMQNRMEVSRSRREADKAAIDKWSGELGVTK